MNPFIRAFNAVIRGLTSVLCRIDAEDLKKVPEEGPLIIIANHVTFLEVPLLYTHLQPRPLTGFAKHELWENPITRPLFDMWGGIPVRRGQPDRAALRQALDALEEGHIMAIAPEGTRSHNGRLQRGHTGVVLLALRSAAPLLPLVYYGGEKLNENLMRLRRTDFHIRVGNPFYLERGEEQPSREMRQQMLDELMYQLAALLPPEYRGVYADLDQATEEYVRFPEGSESNLPDRREKAEPTTR